MGFTTSAATSILQNQIKNCYVGLSTTTPTAAGGNFSEPSASTGYERASIGNLNTSISAQVANDAIIFFNETLGSYGTITYFGLFSSKTGGTPFFVGELTDPLTIDTGYVPIFRAENLIIGLDKAALSTY